jgi:antitoxin FitA
MGVIQVRGVSEAAHERLRAKAAEEGLSLSEYLRRELEDLADTLTWSEWMERVRARRPAQGLTTSAADLIREGREERERHLEEVLERRDAGR